MNGSGTQRKQIGRGSILGAHYEVIECLGDGSRGTVYLCRDGRKPQFTMAVKVMWVSKRELAAEPEMVERFQNEANICHRIRHENIVRSFEYFCGDGYFAYSMEFVPGRNVADLIDAGPVDADEVVRLLEQACKGLQAVHEHGVIHRDIKPENLLLSLSGDLRISDFGIARLSEGRKLTAQGAVLGTVDYLSPEYLRDDVLDARSDIYALGLVAYEMVTGRKPYEAGSNLVLSLRRRLMTDPTPPKEITPSCPQDLSDLIMKALARNPLDRFQTTSELLTAIGMLASVRAKRSLRRSGRGFTRPFAWIRGLFRHEAESFGLSPMRQFVTSWGIVLLFTSVSLGATYVAMEHPKALKRVTIGLLR